MGNLPPDAGAWLRPEFQDFDREKRSFLIDVAQAHIRNECDHYHHTVFLVRAFLPLSFLAGPQLASAIELSPDAALGAG